MSFMQRRSFLKGLGSAFGLNLVSPLAWADSSNPSSFLQENPLSAHQAMGNGRNFLFIHARGGWDPLCVFAPQFDDDLIQMEPESEPVHWGGLSLVDGPQRSAVANFFRQYAHQSVVFNGVSTRSVNHETCEAVALTGSTSSQNPDWATLIASAYAHSTTLPHLSFSGPVFPGHLGVLVNRAQGALHSILNGEFLNEALPFTEPLTSSTHQQVQSYLQQRIQSLSFSSTHKPTSTHYQGLLKQIEQAQSRSHQLWTHRKEVDFTPSSSLVEQAQKAIRALSLGVCQCASLSTQEDWDTHNDNRLQNELFNTLFSDLSEIMNLLETTSDSQGISLAQKTIVVVMSEMGRTPAYNLTGGRDHWPFTSFLMLGQGLKGGQIVGGYRPGFMGVGVNPYSLELDESRIGISAEEIGSTLFLLAGLDPQHFLPHTTPLYGVIDERI